MPAHAQARPAARPPLNIAAAEGRGGAGRGPPRRSPPASQSPAPPHLPVCLPALRRRASRDAGRGGDRYSGRGAVPVSVCGGGGGAGRLPVKVRVPHPGVSGFGAWGAKLPGESLAWGRDLRDGPGGRWGTGRPGGAQPAIGFAGKGRVVRQHPVPRSVPEGGLRAGPPWSRDPLSSHTSAVWRRSSLSERSAQDGLASLSPGSPEKRVSSPQGERQSWPPPLHNTGPSRTLSLAWVGGPWDRKGCWSVPA